MQDGGIRFGPKKLVPVGRSYEEILQEVLRKKEEEQKKKISTLQTPAYKSAQDFVETNLLSKWFVSPTQPQAQIKSSSQIGAPAVPETPSKYLDFVKRNFAENEKKTVETHLNFIDKQLSNFRKQVELIKNVDVTKPSIFQQEQTPYVRMSGTQDEQEADMAIGNYIDKGLSIARRERDKRKIYSGDLSVSDFVENPTLALRTFASNIARNAPIDLTGVPIISGLFSGIDVIRNKYPRTKEELLEKIMFDNFTSEPTPAVLSEYYKTISEKQPELMGSYDPVYELGKKVYYAEQAVTKYDKLMKENLEKELERIRSSEIDVDKAFRKIQELKKIDPERAKIQEQIFSKYISYIASGKTTKKFTDNIYLNEIAGGLVSGLSFGLLYDPMDGVNEGIMKNHISASLVKNIASDNPEVLKMYEEMVIKSEVDEREKADFYNSVPGQVVYGVSNMIGSLPYFMLGGAGTSKVLNILNRSLATFGVSNPARAAQVAKLMTTLAKNERIIHSMGTFALAELPRNIIENVKHSKDGDVFEILKGVIGDEVNAAMTGALFHYTGKIPEKAKSNLINLYAKATGKAPNEIQRIFYESIFKAKGLDELFARTAVGAASMVGHGASGYVAGIVQNQSQSEAIVQGLTFATLSAIPLGKLSKLKERVLDTEHLKDKIELDTREKPQEQSKPELLPDEGKPNEGKPGAGEPNTTPSGTAPSGEAKKLNAPETDFEKRKKELIGKFSEFDSNKRNLDLTYKDNILKEVLGEESWLKFTDKLSIISKINSLKDSVLTKDVKLTDKEQELIKNITKSNIDKLSNLIEYLGNLVDAGKVTQELSVLITRLKELGPSDADAMEVLDKATKILYDDIFKGSNVYNYALNEIKKVVGEQKITDIVNIFKDEATIRGILDKYNKKINKGKKDKTTKEITQTEEEKKQDEKEIKKTILNTIGGGETESNKKKEEKETKKKSEEEEIVDLTEPVTITPKSLPEDKFVFEIPKVEKDKFSKQLNVRNVQLALDSNGDVFFLDKGEFKPIESDDFTKARYKNLAYAFYNAETKNLYIDPKTKSVYYRDGDMYVLLSSGTINSKEFGNIFYFKDGLLRQLYEDNTLRGLTPEEAADVSIDVAQKTFIKTVKNLINNLNNIKSTTEGTSGGGGGASTGGTGSTTSGGKGGKDEKPTPPPDDISETQLSPVAPNEYLQGKYGIRTILGLMNKKASEPEFNALKEKKYKDIFKSDNTMMELGIQPEENIKPEEATWLEANIIFAHLANEMIGQPRANSPVIIRDIIAELIANDKEFRDLAGKVTENTILNLKTENKYWEKLYPQIIREEYKKYVDSKSAEANGTQGATEQDKERVGQGTKTFETISKVIESLKNARSLLNPEDNSVFERMEAVTNYDNIEPLLPQKYRVGLLNLHKMITSDVATKGYDNSLSDFLVESMSEFKARYPELSKNGKILARMDKILKIVHYNLANSVKVPVLDLITSVSSSGSSCYGGATSAKLGNTFSSSGIIIPNVLHKVTNFLSSILNERVEHVLVNKAIFEENGVVNEYNVNHLIQAQKAGADVRFYTINKFNDEYDPDIIKSVRRDLKPEEVELALQNNKTVYYTNVKQKNISDIVGEKNNGRYGDLTLIDYLSSYLKSGIFLMYPDNKNTPICLNVPNAINNLYEGYAFQTGIYSKMGEYKVLTGKMYTELAGRMYNIFKRYIDIYPDEKKNMLSEKVTFRVSHKNIAVTDSIRIKDLLTSFSPIDATKSKDKLVTTKSSDILSNLNKYTEKIANKLADELDKKGIDYDMNKMKIEVKRDLLSQISRVGDKVMMSMMWHTYAGYLTSAAIGGNGTIDGTGKTKTYAKFIEQTRKFLNSAKFTTINKRLSLVNKLYALSDLNTGKRVVQNHIKNHKSFEIDENGEPCIRVVIFDEELLTNENRLEDNKKLFEQLKANPRFAKVMPEKTYEEFLSNFILDDGSFNYDGSGIMLDKTLNALNKIYDQKFGGASLKTDISYIGEQDGDIALYKLALHGTTANSYLGAHGYSETGTANIGGFISKTAVKILGSKYTGKIWDLLSPITEENVIKIPLKNIKKIFDSNIHTESAGLRSIMGTDISLHDEYLKGIYDKHKPETAKDYEDITHLMVDIMKNYVDVNTKDIITYSKLYNENPKEFINLIKEKFKDDDIVKEGVSSMLDIAEMYPGIVYTAEFQPILDYMYRNIMKKTAEGKGRGTPVIYSPYEKNIAMEGVYTFTVAKYLRQLGEGGNLGVKAEKLGKLLFRHYHNADAVNFSDVVKEIQNAKIKKTLPIKQIVLDAQKTISEAFDEKGHIKHGYLAVGSVVYDKFRDDLVNNDHKAFMSIIPMENASAFNGVKVISLLPSTSHSISIMYNPKVGISIWGKDFDIDKFYLTFNNQGFGDKFHALWDWVNAAGQEVMDYAQTFRQNDLPKIQAAFKEKHKDDEYTAIVEAQKQFVSNVLKGYSGDNTYLDAAIANFINRLGSNKAVGEITGAYQNNMIGELSNIRKITSEASTTGFTLNINIPYVDGDKVRFVVAKVGIDPKRERMKNFNIFETPIKTGALDPKNGATGFNINTFETLRDLFISLDYTKYNDFDIPQTPINVMFNTIREVFLKLFQYPEYIRRGKDEYNQPINLEGYNEIFERYKIHKERVNALLRKEFDREINGITVRDWLGEIVENSIKKYRVFVSNPNVSKEESDKKVATDTERYKNFILDSFMKSDMYMDLEKSQAIYTMDKLASTYNGLPFDTERTAALQSNVYKELSSSVAPKINNIKLKYNHANWIKNNKTHTAIIDAILGVGSYTYYDESFKNLTKKMNVTAAGLMEFIKNTKLENVKKTWGDIITNIYKTAVDLMFANGIPFNQDVRYSVNLDLRAVKGKNEPTVKTLKQKYETSRPTYLPTNIKNYFNVMERSIENDGKRIIIHPSMSRDYMLKYSSIMDPESLKLLKRNPNTTWIVEETVNKDKILASAKIIPLEEFDYKKWFIDSEFGLARMEALEKLCGNYIKLDQKQAIINDIMSMVPEEPQYNIAMRIIAPDSKLINYSSVKDMNTIGSQFLNSLSSPAAAQVLDSYYKLLGDKATKEYVPREDNADTYDANSHIFSGFAVPLATATGTSATGIVAPLLAIGGMLTRGLLRIAGKAAYKKGELPYKAPGKLLEANKVVEMLKKNKEELVSILDNTITNYEKMIGAPLPEIRSMAQQVKNIEDLSTIEAFNCIYSITDFLKSYNREVKRIKGSFGHDFYVALRNFMNPLFITSYFGKNNLVHKGSDVLLKNRFVNPLSVKEENNITTEEDVVRFKHVNALLTGGYAGDGTYTINPPGKVVAAIGMYTSQNLQYYRELIKRMEVFADQNYATVDNTKLLIRMNDIEKLGLTFDDNVALLGSKVIRILREDLFRKNEDGIIKPVKVNAKYIRELTKSLPNELKEGIKNLATEVNIMLGIEPNDPTTEKALIHYYTRKVLHKAAIVQAKNTIYDMIDSYKSFGLNISKSMLDEIDNRFNQVLYDVDNEVFIPTEIRNSKYRTEYYKHVYTNAYDVLFKYSSLVREANAQNKKGKQIKLDQILLSNGLNQADLQVVKRELMNVLRVLTNGRYLGLDPYKMLKEHSLHSILRYVNNAFNFKFGVNLSQPPETILNVINSAVERDTNKFVNLEILNPGSFGIGITGASHTYHPTTPDARELITNEPNILIDNKIFSDYSEYMINSLNRTILNAAIRLGNRFMDTKGEYGMIKELVNQYYRNVAGADFTFTNKKAPDELKPGEIICIDNLSNEGKLRYFDETIQVLEDSGDITHYMYSIDKNEDKRISGFVAGIDKDRKIITIVHNIDEIYKPKKYYQYYYGDDNNPFVYTPRTKDTVRLISNGFQKLMNKYSKTDLPGLKEMEAYDNAFVSGVQKAVNLGTTLTTSLLIGGARAISFVLRNIINAGYFQLYGGKAQLDYYRRLASNLFNEQTDIYGDIKQMINGTTLLSFFSEDSHVQYKHLHDLKDSFSRIFLNVEETKRLGKNYGLNAIPEFIHSFTNLVNWVSTFGGMLTKAEAAQRSAIVQERIMRMMGENVDLSNIDKISADLAGLMAVWSYTGLYGSHKPIATNTILGKFFNLFLPWRSARIGRIMSMVEGVYQDKIFQAVNEALDNKDLFQAKNNMRAYPEWNERKNKYEVRYGTNWLDQRKLFAGSLAGLLTIQSIASFINAGIMYTLMKSLFDDDKVENVRRTILTSDGVLDFYSLLRNIAKYGDVASWIGDPVLDQFRNLYETFDVTERMKEGRNKNVLSKPQMSLLDRSPLYSLDDRRPNKLELAADLVEGNIKNVDDLMGKFFTMQSELGSVMQNNAQSLAPGVGWGMLFSEISDLALLGLMSYTDENPDIIKRFARENIYGHMRDVASQGLFGWINDIMGRGGSYSLTRTYEPKDVLSNILGKATSVEGSVYRTSNISNKIIRNERKKYKPFENKKELLERIIEASNKANEE